MTHQDQVSEEEQVSKKTIEQNFVKRQVRSIVGNQVQGLAHEQTFKKTDEQTKGFCQSKSVKRQLIRCATKNQVEGSMEQVAAKKKKIIPKCPAMSLNEYINKNDEQDMEQDMEQNYVKRQVRSTMAKQVQGLALEQTFKKTDEPNKGFCQSKSVKRQLIRCATKNQVEGSMEQVAAKKKKTVPKCPTL
ncbi:hypothetical protein JHK85_010715 [Glycine max]|nr:hypothetical protein JHK85_010715 [Glycine max]